MDAPVTSAAVVNRELKRLGHEERLVQGNGYCYFVGGRSSEWFSSSVPVCYTKSLSLRRWLEEHAALAAATR